MFVSLGTAQTWPCPIFFLDIGHDSEVQATPSAPSQSCARVALHEALFRQLSNYPCMAPTWPWEDKRLNISYFMPVAQVRGHWAQGGDLHAKLYVGGHENQEC